MMDDHIRAAVLGGVPGAVQRRFDQTAEGAGQAGEVAHSVADGHRLADRQHVDVQRRERHLAGDRQRLEQRGRGEHDLMAFAAQPVGECDHGTDVALRTHRE
jgi:hypothetical protein